MDAGDLCGNHYTNQTIIPHGILDLYSDDSLTSYTTTFTTGDIVYIDYYVYVMQYFSTCPILNISLVYNGNHSVTINLTFLRYLY